MATLHEVATELAGVALRQVIEPDHGVRVEDYLTVLAASAGESALAAAGFDVEEHTLAPGSALFYEPVNAILTGDPIQRPAALGTVWSFIEPLADGYLPAGSLPDPEELYRRVAANVGSADWGWVPVSVPDDNRSRVMPLRGAFELRGAVLELEHRFGATPRDRHLVTASALVVALKQVKDAIDPAVAIRLATETLFGMAKMAPMTSSAMASTSTAPTADD